VATYLKKEFQRRQHQQEAAGEEDKEELSVGLDDLVTGHSRMAAARWFTDVLSLQVRRERVTEAGLYHDYTALCMSLVSSNTAVMCTGTTLSCLELATQGRDALLYTAPANAASGRAAPALCMFKVPPSRASRNASGPACRPVGWSH
jgi:hypothetical protein